MVKFLFWVVLGYGVYLAVNYYQSRQLPEGAYIAVYGRDRCSITQNTLRSLRERNVPHHYFIVDEQDTADRLHGLMKTQGLSTRRYLLPVVDTNGELAIRPDTADVIANYQRGLMLLEAG